MSPEIQTSNQDQKPEIPAFRIVPHIEGTRSLHFDIIEREVPDGVVIKIGRFTDKSQVPNRITFKSKVVSRGHAEIWHSEGKFYIKDTKSSSGTFINHVRLSPPNTESKPHLLKDGDIIQLGVDYQGGTEEIYRCVKMRVELNNSWQRPIKFSLNALKQFKQITQLGNSEAMKQITDCCICLSGIGPCQALFLAPCSHVFHYKCIRPILFSHHSGFLCPLCRSFADLEAPIDNSIDWEQLLAEQEEAEKQQEANNAQKKDEESLNNNNNNDSEDNDNNREWGDNLAEEELMDEESSNSNENYDNDNNQTVDLSTTPVNNNNMITTITPTITTASSSSTSNASAIGATAQKATISSNNSSTNANSNPPSTAS